MGYTEQKARTGIQSDNETAEYSVFDLHIEYKNYKLSQMRIWKSFVDIDNGCYGISGFEATWTGLSDAEGYEPITLMYGEQKL